MNPRDAAMEIIIPFWIWQRDKGLCVETGWVEAGQADAAQQGARAAASPREWELFALVAFQSCSDASEAKGFQGNVRDAHLVTSKALF